VKTGKFQIFFFQVFVHRNWITQQGTLKLMSALTEDFPVWRHHNKRFRTFLFSKYAHLVQELLNIRCATDSFGP